jgi:hypothetical protein
LNNHAALQKRHYLDCTSTSTVPPYATITPHPPSPHRPLLSSPYTALRLQAQPQPLSPTAQAAAQKTAR